MVAGDLQHLALEAVFIPSLIINVMGLFYCPKFSMEAAMSDLSNAEIFNRWKQCKTSKRLQAADYWYNFMLVRAKYGDKQAQGIVSTMDRLK